MWEQVQLGNKFVSLKIKLKNSEKLSGRLKKKKSKTN